MIDCCKLINVEGRLCVIEAGQDKLNRGGLIEIFVICQDGVLSVPAYSFSLDANQKAELDGQMQLKSNAEAYRFRFTPQTAAFREIQQETDHGSYYDQSLVLQIPKDRSEITWLKYQMRNKRYTFLYRDQNGIAKYLPNLRVKFDLDTKTKPADYNGHALTARKASKTPALNWKLSAGQTVEDIFLPATLQFKPESFNFPGGIQANDIIELAFTPYSPESIILILDDVLKLEPGTHFVLNGDKIILKFSKEATAAAPATIHAFYAYEDQGSTIGSYAYHLETKSAPYVNGETFLLPDAPLDINHLYITFNDSLVLQPGEHFNLVGNTVTILFDSEPSASDTDTFNCLYLRASGNLDLNGFKNHIYKTKLAIPTSTIINLPHAPISGSLMIWYNNSLRFREGIHFNISGNAVTILFDIDATSGDDPTILDFWYSY